MNEKALLKAIARDLGLPARELEWRPPPGGDINKAMVLLGPSGAWFVKLNHEKRLPMFETEAEGLEALARCRELRVPEPLVWGRAHGHSYLVLEYIELHPLTPSTRPAFGRGLAALHSLRGPAFGWHRDNTIGTTPQPNGWMDDWTDFWRQRRLGHQLTLAGQNGYAELEAPGDKLLAQLDTLLEGHKPRPALTHGDLWGGNAAADSRGRPVVYDPAVYYGDRETDLAMMALFGGFGDDCLDAYAAELPLDPGYAEIRRDLYQLYHVLNHCNLFGGPYANTAKQLMERLIGESG